MRVLLVSLLLLSFVPAAAAVDVALTIDDPTGDVDHVKDGTDATTGDVTRVVSSLDGDDVVIRIETAGDLAANAAFMVDVFYKPGTIMGEKLNIAGEVASGSVQGDHFMGPSSGQKYPVAITTEARAVTLRFAASVLPDDASCFDLAATLFLPQPGGNAEDRAGRTLMSASACSESKSQGSGAGANGEKVSTPGLALPLAVLALVGVALIARRK